MKKKRYEAPAIRKVRLVVENAVLAVCHSSPNLNPRSVTGEGCRLQPTCFNPPS
jgi:hypothetical protein